MISPIIDLNPVEPARFGFRQARGAKFSATFQFRQPNGTAADMTAVYPQLVFRPHSKGGAWGYDIDPVTGLLEIDGAFFNDPLGYGLELYSRDSDGHPNELLAHGEMALSGGAYAYEGPFGPLTLPTPPAGATGAMGPAGPASTVPGPAGEPGQRGSLWFTGEGAPVGGENYIEGDMYLDQLSGDTWRFDESRGMWSRA